MGQAESKGRFWPVLAAACVLMIMLAAFHWSLDHPFGTSWDEGEYINQVFYDAQRLEHGMLLKLAGRIMLKSSIRPPAYRPLALPFVVLFGFHAASPRLLSLLCFALTSWFVFLATRRVAGKTAGAFAVLIFALSPVVVSASMWYSTEGPLYLATSAMLYFLIALWTDNSERTSAWIGLGLAVGLGFLSKASFAAVAIPALAFWPIVARWKRPAIPGLASEVKAGLVAILVAGPWWLLNIKPAIGGVRQARAFVANSLGPPSPATWARWLGTVIQSLLGHGISGLILLVVGVWFWKGVVKKQSLLNPLERAILGVCACAGLPIILAQLSGTNSLLRHISPAVIPMAIFVGVLGVRTGWVDSAAGVALSCVLVGVQFLMIMTPVLFPNKAPVSAGFVNAPFAWRVMTRRDQWDWSPLYRICKNCGLASPAIAYLGFGPGLCPDLIRFPWVVEAAGTSSANLDFPEVTWLWRHEQGQIDWPKVMDAAGKADLVLTAPNYVGVSEEDTLNNPHNSEFAERLNLDPRFQGPVHIRVGRFTPADIWVFVRKSTACQMEHESQ